MKFNINHHVRVRLTETGRAILRAGRVGLWRNHPNPPMYKEPQEDADGWSRWQHWELMSIFGPHMSDGASVPFETEIRIEETAEN